MHILPCPNLGALYHTFDDMQAAAGLSQLEGRVLRLRRRRVRAAQSTVGLGIGESIRNLELLDIFSPFATAAHFFISSPAWLRSQIPGHKVSKGIMAPFVKDSAQVPWPSNCKNEPVPDTPFSRAIDDFLVELNAEDDPKNPFLRELNASRQQVSQSPGCKSQAQASAANLRDFMKDLQTQKSSGHGMRILARLDPFIDSLGRVMGLCENMLGAAPLGVSVAFSGARIVLKLASDMQACLDSIFDAMEQIGISLKCYDKFAHAFPDSDEVQDLLISSYKSIVYFWFKASRILSRNSLRTFIRGATRPIEKDIKTALDGLSRDRSNVTALAQATTADQAINRIEATLKQGVIDWINGGSYIDARPILQDELDLRLQGTCNWLFDDKRFLNWYNANENAALWYNAKPGSGKSVYAAALADFLRKRDKKVAYFF